MSKKIKYNVILALSAINIFSIFRVISLDNQSRLPENINTDFFMNSLPYLWVLVISPMIIIGICIFSIIKINKNKRI